MLISKFRNTISLTGVLLFLTPAYSTTESVPEYSRLQFQSLPNVFLGI